MTQRDFDQLLTGALLDAALLDASPALAGAEGMDIPWSPRYLRRRARLLRAPFAVVRRRAVPVWRQTVTAAACAILILSVALGGILAVSPQVRAWAQMVWATWFDTNTEYTFQGEAPPGYNPEAVWHPTYLPEGFEEVSAEGEYGIWRVLFGSATGETIILDYQPMQAGMGFAIDNEHSEYTQISIRGMAADLYRSNTEGKPSFLIWADYQRGTAFLLMSECPADELVKIAEGMEPVQ